MYDSDTFNLDHQWMLFLSRGGQENLRQLRGSSFFTLHRRSGYYVWGYETFCPTTFGGMKHFEKWISGVRNIWKNLWTRGVRNISPKNRSIILFLRKFDLGYETKIAFSQLWNAFWAFIWKKHEKHGKERNLYSTWNIWKVK